MEILIFITKNALIHIPVLIIIGLILKKLEFILLILLPLGIVGAMALGGWTFYAAIQGILVTGAAVYGNQIVKQLRKNE